MTTPFSAQGHYINFRLQKRYEAIRRDLEPDRILGYLYQEEVIDIDDMDEVKAEKTRKKKAEQLLDILQGKMREDPSHKAMEVFVNVLEQRQPHLARILKTQVDGECYAVEKRRVQMNDNSPIGQVSSQFSGMHIEKPQGRPNAVENELHVYSLQPVGTKGTGALQGPPILKPVQYDKLPPHIDCDHEDVYPMKRNPRGLAVIINIMNFTPNEKYTSKKLERRDGSEEDVRRLEKLFNDLFFKVCVHEDLSGEDLMNLLADYSKYNHSNFDAFVLCLMSHGEEDGILGADGYYVNICDVRNMFDSANCLTLLGKPKIFIIQACRGLEIDKGQMERRDGPFATPTPEADVTEKKDAELSGGQVWKFDFPMKQIIARSADFVIAYACVSGFASFRNVKNGSRFVQAIDEVFCECAGYEHLFDMLTKVNKKVNDMGDKKMKQIPQPLSTLRKKLYFWPYLSENSPTTHVFN